MDENRNIPLHSPQPVAPQPSLIGSLVATSPSITGSSPVLIEGSPIAPHSEGARRGSAVSSRASNLLELNAPEQPSLAAFAAPSSFSRYHDRQHSRSPSKSPKAIYSPSNIIQGCKIPRSPSPSSRGRSSSRREQAASRASSAVKSFLSPSPNRYRSPVTIHRRRTPSHSRERRRDWHSRTPVCSRRSRSRYERRSPSPSRDRCGNRTWISRSPSPYTRDRYRSRIEIHSRYRFVDANVSIIVEDRIRFDVHRHFLERDSVFLQGMLSARPNGQDGSYNLAGLTIQEFESLLGFFYDGMYRMSPTDTSIQSWVDLLAASTKLHFAKARQHAIAAIEICRSSSGDHLTPARMIYLATTYGVMEWLEPAYAALIEREELMSDEEAEMIGAKRVLLVAKARETRLKERPLRHADWEPRNQAGPSASSALYGPCLGSQPFPHPPAPISCVQTPITEDDWDCTGTTVSPPLTGRSSCCDISPASITLPPSPGGSPYPFRSSASLRSSLTPSSPSSPSSLPSNEIRSRTPNDHPSSTRYSPTRHDRPPQVDRLATPLPGVTIALSTLIPGSLCAEAYPGPPPPEIHMARSSVSPVSTATSYSGTFRCSWGHPSQPSPRLGGDASGKTLCRRDLLKEKDGSRLLPVNDVMRPKSLTETVVDTIFDS